MKKTLANLFVAILLFTFSDNANGQVDEICREFGIVPSLDSPWAQVPYLYGKVVLNGFDAAAKSRVTVVFSDRDNPSKRITLSKSGAFCFKRSGSGGSIVIEVNGVEVARRALASFGSAQQREDFDIYPTADQTPQPPGTISAKFQYPKNEKTVELYQRAAEAEKGKEYEKAIGVIKEIVVIDSADFIAWSILGSLYLENKLYAESDAAFRKSLELKIEYTPAWINVARLRIAQKQPEAAIELLKHAISLEPKSARPFRLLGETYLQTKQGTLAVDALNKAIELDPIGMADCHLLLGRLFDAAGAKKYATREFKAYLEKVPDYAEKERLKKYIKDNPE